MSEQMEIVGSDLVEIVGEGPEPGALARYNATIRPPMVDVRAERGASTYLGAARFETPQGPIEIVVTLPIAVVEAARKRVEAGVRRLHTYLHNVSGELDDTGERIDAERVAALACCGAAAKAKMHTIARDPVLAKRLGLSTPATATARSLTAYKQAAELLDRIKTPEGRAEAQRLAAQAKLGFAPAQRAARILQLVAKSRGMAV